MISLTTSPRRLASVVASWRVPASSDFSWASRLEIVWDSRESPSSVPRTSPGVLRNVSESVVRLVASCWVSSWSIVPESPLNASTTSNGDFVRSLVMTSSESCSASPRGSSARNFEPSSVRISIEPVVRLPIQASVTLNVTRTWSRSSSTLLIRPTSTPATVTWSSACSPAASLNSAS